MITLWSRNTTPGELCRDWASTESFGFLFTGVRIARSRRESEMARCNSNKLHGRRRTVWRFRSRKKQLKLRRRCVFGLSNGLEHFPAYLDSATPVRVQDPDASPVHPIDHPRTD